MSTKETLGPWRQQLREWLLALEVGAGIPPRTREEALAEANRRRDRAKLSQLSSSTVSDRFNQGSPARDFTALWSLVEVFLEWSASGTDTGTRGYAAALREHQQAWKRVWEHARADRKPPGFQPDTKPERYQPKRAVNLPARTAFFTGREGLLDRLGSLLRDGPVCGAALRGMGGIGKSQLALEYAHRQYAVGSYDIVWWVRTEQRVAMDEDLLGLAAPLGLPGASVDAVLAGLGRKLNWLLIYDNITDAALIEGRIPASGHVILTSRSRGWSRYARPLDIGVFTAAESVSFLQDRTGFDESEAASELASELGHLPLALAQAASYCEEHDLSIRGYLELFRSPRVRARLLETGLHSDEYPDNVATTWLLHVDHLRKRRPAALQLLRLCAVLNPDLIRLDLILWRYQLLPEPLASAASSLDEQLTGAVEQIRGVSFESLEEVIGDLIKTGLVTRLGDRAIRIHRLVQAAARQEMGEERTSAWRTYADLLVHALRPYPPFPVASQYELGFTHLRIHGAHLQRLLREGRSPDEPMPVNRLVALTDSVEGSDVEIITDFEYAYECAYLLSLALHRGSQLGYCALALANLGYVRCLTGRHDKAVDAMEKAASLLNELGDQKVTTELSEAVRICKTHSAPDPLAGATIFIVEEHADLDEVGRIRATAADWGAPVHEGNRECLYTPQ